MLWLWWQGRATPGDVAYVLTTFFVIQGYLRDVGMHIRNLQRSVNDMEELVDFHAEPIGVADRPGARPIEIAGGEVSFDRVKFHYAGHATPLYEAFSVKIAAGEKVGLVGRSGSGKTTFVKLIQRLYDVNEGQILIDGQDVALGDAGVAPRADRDRPAGADPLPPLACRRTSPTGGRARGMAEIERAARLANAHDFIARLPNGYATLVGERGVKLSGGERQRVALARAFLADAPILILDEATSSLDSEFGAADPGGDGAADPRAHGDRHRAPAVDGAGDGPHPRLRARARSWRRGGTPSSSAASAASIAACSRSRRASWCAVCRSWRRGGGRRKAPAFLTPPRAGARHRCRRR